jgi:serine/threonine protein kinase
MGEVARDTRLDRIVALKVLPSALASDSRSRAQFKREARAISPVDDPHICALYDVGEDGGISYLVITVTDTTSAVRTVVRAGQVGVAIRNLRAPLHF